MANQEQVNLKSTLRIQRMIRPELLKKNEQLKWSSGSGIDVWDLFCAAISGDINTAKILLEKDPSLIHCTYEYRGPLYFAVRENQVKMTAFLISNGADPAYSITGDNFLTIASDRDFLEMHQFLKSTIEGKNGDLVKGEAMAEAIRNRDLSTLQNILNISPELVHSADERNNQPIHWAVMTRQIDIIDELLSRGADINARRSDGARPVQLINGDYHYRGWTKEFPFTSLEILAHLRKKGAYIDICTAAYNGDKERVEELLKKDPLLANRVSEYITYYPGSGAPIRNAAANGHMEIVKLLLDYGADPNLREEGIAPNGHALHSAVCNGHLEIVKLLLERGAHPNVEIESSADTLCAAISRNNQAMVELLCSYGAASALHLLAYYGYIQTAAAVLAANPLLADDPYALECAANQGHNAFVRLMLRHKPNLATRISSGVNSQGPQDVSKSRELIEYLFQQGMDPNLPNWLRITPLHRFAGRGDLENAALYIDHGADLHSVDEDICSTPLGWASKFGRTSMVELLLERGSNPNLPENPDWAKPLSWATKRGREKIVELLKQNGATE
jgi:ankyrin repeat protein